MLHFPKKWIEEERRRLFEIQRASSFEPFRNHPNVFFRNVLGIKAWARQRALLDAVAKHDRVGVRSGQKTSKSNSAAGLALWFAATRPGARVFCLAPTFAQVKNIIWRELRLRAGPVTAVLGGRVAKDPSTGIDFSNGSQILGLSTNQRENLAGLSSPGGILFIIDEASGFPDELFHVVRGNAAGGAKILAISNPTLRGDCTWYPELFESPVWHTLRISSEDTPNVQQREIVVPGLATWDWILEMRAEYGPNYLEHPEYLIRVLGEFASLTEETVVKLVNIMAAQTRWTLDRVSYGTLRMGVDPAGYGVDDSAFAMARGNHCYRIQTISGNTDPEDIGRHALTMADRHRTGDEKVVINMDALGDGARAVTACKSLARERKARNIVVTEHFGSAKPTEKNENEYLNRRAEVWYETDRWLAKDGSIPPDDELRAELLTARRQHAIDGRKAIEAKEKTKRRGHGSPNKADALTLAVNAPPPPPTGGYKAPKSRRGKAQSIAC